MTENQKYLWDILPIGKWVKRNDADFEFNDRHRCGHFQRALTWLHYEDFVELKWGNEISDDMEQETQYIRRRPTSEIQEIILRKR